MKATKYFLKNIRIILFFLHDAQKGKNYFRMRVYKPELNTFIEMYLDRKELSLIQCILDLENFNLLPDGYQLIQNFGKFDLMKNSIFTGKSFDLDETIFSFTCYTKMVDMYSPLGEVVTNELVSFSVDKRIGMSERLSQFA